MRSSVGAMRKITAILSFAVGISAVLILTHHTAWAQARGEERVFSIEEKILLTGLPDDVSALRIWIPYPLQDNQQSVEDVKIEGPFEYQILTDKEYGNKILFFKAKQPLLDSDTAEIVLSFKVQRKEYGIADLESSLDKDLRRFLRADRLVPVNGELRKLAEKITEGKSSDLEKVRIIYEYIINELTYAKDDPKVCGIGDSLLTLQHKKGICTDYHSLFISLARSLGIPAKFEIGFRIPDDVKEGMLNGYHCWAKFYLKDKGWIPVDISEADKHPEKKDYFFGAIDENRLHLTTGRDIQLTDAQATEPLNFFVYPYAELSGRQWHEVETKISFDE